MPFNKLSLMEPLLRAVHSEGYSIPTAIQLQAIPLVLAGKDLFGCAQTGTGKTAAFALPILQLLHGHAAHPHHRPIRALILTPTRELAAQIDQSFAVYGKHMHLRHTVVFGGVGQSPQVRALRAGVDILVATPGRLLDLLNQRQLTLQEVKILVLDEADRMLDMGFIQDIRRIVAQVPRKRQTLMFSATLPKEIRAMADQMLFQPVEVRIPSESPAADTVQQTLYFVDQTRKGDLLEQLLKDPQVSRALVFTRTKRRADQVTKRLVHSSIAAEAIHSNKSQNARTRALDNFKRSKTRVLVASDIAARGLDVDAISHVINYDVPNVPETYVHRIGRTGRAGAAGRAVTFCSDDQRTELRDIEKLLGRSIPVLRHALKPLPHPQPDTAQKSASGRPHHRYTSTHASADTHHPAARPQSSPQPRTHSSQPRRTTRRPIARRRKRP